MIDVNFIGESIRDSIVPIMAMFGQFFPIIALIVGIVMAWRIFKVLLGIVLGWSQK
jgi:hypothetical protein